MQNSDDSPFQQLSSTHFFPALASLWWVLRHLPQCGREYETGLFVEIPKQIFGSQLNAINPFPDL